MMPNNDYVKREDIYPAVTEIAKEIVFGSQDDDKVVDIINSIPAADVEPKRRWIPVTERPPKEPGEYIVAYHPCYWDVVGPSVKVGIDTFRGKTAWAKNKYQRVIAWQEKPEPPKEGEDAE